MSSHTPVQRRTNPPRRAKEAVDAASASTSWDERSTTTPPVPNSTEALLLAVYPATLLLGSAFSLLSPATRHGTYDAASQSYAADVMAPSYFARKSNVFNRYFVKIGWFWVTAAFAAFAGSRALRRAERHKTPLGTHRAGSVAAAARLPPAVQALLRWGLATAWWVATTQWFLGPPLIDRGFRWTGGRCHVVLAKGPNDMARAAAPDVEQLVSAAACRAIGGAWRGGHDISGHVFLLTLGSAFLAMEILPAVLNSLRARAESSATDHAPHQKQDPIAEPAERAVRYATYFAAVVGFLCLWMLLMTAVYFHTWFEKFTGLTVAFSSIASIYFLPRLLPGLRSVVGAPSL